MKPRISVLTLGVDDLEKAVAFYRDGLGLATEGIVGKEFEHGAVAFFDLQSGLKLALWAQEDIAYDTGLPKTSRCPTGFTIGHNVASKNEVDDVEFLTALQDQLGAEGDLAAQYIVAHEYGHHVQNVLGINADVQRGAAAGPEPANEYCDSPRAAGRLPRRGVGPRRRAAQRARSR